MSNDKPVIKNIYSCDACGKKFTKLEKLKVHLIIHSNEAYKYSETSDETFREKDELKKNSQQKTDICNLSLPANKIKNELSTHSHLESKDVGERGFCEGTYSSESNVKHNLNIHKKEKSVSEEGGKAVIKKGSLRSQFCSLAKNLNRGSEVCDKALSEEPHLLAHREEKRHSCEVWGKTFTKNSALKKHLLIHSNEKSYICGICERGFTQNCHLKRHLLVHTKEKPHSCILCGKVFSRKYNLTGHLRTHTKEKPYNCEICNRNFTQKSSLNIHLLVHTKDKTLFCEICLKAFKYKRSLNDHLRFHTGEKPYACDVCDKAFAYLKSLKFHLLSHTKDKPYNCEICCKSFTEKNNFDSHLLNHRKKNQTYIKPEMKHSSDDEL